jgi:hypothetical protein
VADPLPHDPEPAASSRLAWIATGVFAGASLVVLAAWLWNDAYVPGLSQDPSPRPIAAQPAPERLPVPSSAEAALTRAQRLQSSGRLHDAMDVLEGIRHGDPLRPRADALRGTIQRQLLESANAIRPQ